MLNGYTFMGDYPVKIVIVCLLRRSLSSLKGKNFFPFRVDLFQNGLRVQEVTKIVSN